MALNTRCKYYPCHDKLEDCGFCYCPIFPCEIEELGHYIKVDEYQEVWDCSECTILHNKENVDLIRKIITDLVRYKLIKK